MSTSLEMPMHPLVHTLRPALSIFAYWEYYSFTVYHPSLVITYWCLLLQAATIGTSGRRLVVSVNNCGICNQELKDFSHMGEEVSDGVGEYVYVNVSVYRMCMWCP